jgi:hypothetical protein
MYGSRGVGGICGFMAVTHLAAWESLEEEARAARYVA